MQNQYIKLYGFGTVLFIYPLLFYVANNTQSFALPEIIITLGLLIITNIFVLGLLQIILKKLNFSKNIFFKISTGLLLLFWLAMMRPVILENPDIHYLVSLIIGLNIHKWIIYALFGLLIFVFGFFIISKNLNFAIGLLFFLNLMNIIQAIASPMFVLRKTATVEGALEIKNKKNIFFILTDSLTNIKGMEMLGLKAEVKPFLNKLEKSGFRLYPDFYTSLQPTSNALYTYINMSYRKEGKVAYLNTKDRGNDILNNGKLYELLRKNGYAINIFHESAFLGTNTCSADRCYFADQPLKKELKARVFAIIAFLVPDVVSKYFTTEINLFHDPIFKTEKIQKIPPLFTSKLADKLDLKKPNFTYIHAISLPGHTGINHGFVS